MDEEILERGTQINFYLHNLLTRMVSKIKHPDYKKPDLHMMVHNIIKDIEAEASNAFLERKEK